MATYGRSSKRLRFFQQFQDMQQQWTDEEAATDLQNYQNEDANRSNQAPAPALTGQDLQRHLTNHDTPISLQCSRSQGTYPYSANTYDMDEIMTDAVVRPIHFGQASYQKSRQGIIAKYEDCGDSTFICGHCGAYFWIREALVSQ